ncbi:MAG: hypothetical protein ABIS51_16690 [Sphingomonas sp.]
MAGTVRSPKTRPANRRRQKIARFVERDGTVERFTFRQTIPYCGHEVECPPSQAQYGAVMDFFLEPCETRFQASTLLSARDYAAEVAGGFSFNASRKHLLWLCTTAFILSDKELRSLVRAWNISHRGYSPAAARGVYLRCYKKVAKFADKLVDDVQGTGAEIFG